MRRLALWLLWVACLPIFALVFGNLPLMLLVLAVMLVTHCLLAILETRP